MQRCDYKKTKEILFQENNLSYYILGAFITDGNVHQDKSRTNSFKCSLSSKDKDWLQIINLSIGNDGRLRQDKPITKNSYGLWIYNKDIYDWLVSHNCVPNKSISAKLPHIPENCFKDFLRGCIDGDGCISRAHYKGSKNGKTYEQITVYLCGASIDLLLPISHILNGLGFEHSFITIKPTSHKMDDRIIIGKNIQYRIQFCGYKKCVPFLKWLYDTQTISMPRKKKLAEEIISHYENGGSSRI